MFEQELKMWANANKMRAGKPANTHSVAIQTQIDRAVSVKDFMETYYRLPDSHAISQAECFLGRWVSSMRQARAGKPKTCIWHEELKDIIYPDFFAIPGREMNVILRARVVLLFMHKNGRKPRIRSEDITERKYAAWINSMVMANRGKKVTSVLYPSVKAMFPIGFFD